MGVLKIHAEELIESENHHFIILSIIVDSGKDHQVATKSCWTNIHTALKYF